MAERNQKPARAAARSKRKAGPPSPPVPVPVVGVGVCAVSLESLAALFQGFEPDLGAAYLVAVRQADVKFADETSWKLWGQLCWLWAAATAGVAAFVIHAKRGAAGLAPRAPRVEGCLRSRRRSLPRPRRRHRPARPPVLARQPRPRHPSTPTDQPPTTDY